MANAPDWRRMSVLASASGVGLAEGHLSGRIDGRASRDKGGGDRVTQGAAQGWAWNLSTSTPCHRLLSRPPEKTQGAESFYSCVGPESALSLCPTAEAPLIFFPSASKGRWQNSPVLWGKPRGSGQKERRTVRPRPGSCPTLVLHQVSSRPLSAPQSPHLCNEELE